MSTSDAVNMDTLAILKEAMEDEFAELVEVFLESSAELLDGMDEALTSGDIETYTRNVHSLKSSSANLGCEILSALAADIEQHCKTTKQFPADPDAVSQLRSAFNAARQVLETA